MDIADMTREELERKLREVTADRDCWIFNCKVLQNGYNELDSKVRGAHEKYNTQ